ncbi:hypothetical protein IWQ61_005310 [Dispira simplex]|nr:hypothetical protein IWQ61_005310 [Dispira simplex]
MLLRVPWSQSAWKPLTTLSITGRRVPQLHITPSRFYRSPSSALRVGSVIEYHSEPWVVLRRDHGGTGRGAALVKMELKNPVTGERRMERCKADTEYEVVSLRTKLYQYLYSANNVVYLMDPETYEEVEVSDDLVEGGASMLKYLQDGMMVTVQVLDDDKALTWRLPKIGTYKVASVTERVNHAKGATLCPAELENGATVLVPNFVNPGDMVKVDLETQKYHSRA